jgi:SpoVK/Ycf46/Vps4 family AAA+-type ATPase
MISVNMTTTDLKSFHYLENGEVSFSVFDTIKSVKKLESGSYKLSWLEAYPSSRVVLKVNRDKEMVKIHDFPDKEKIDDLITSFFEKRVINEMTELGFYHKVGVLLYGKEGTGKSTIIKHYCKRLIEEQGAIIFYMECLTANISKCWDVVMDVRRVQETPIVVIFEEFDELIENRQEAFLKTALDGNMSIDNCIFFSTTNYIADIPEAIKDRPSRFKYCLNIEGIQGVEDVKTIIKGMLKNNFSDDDIDTFANELKGQTLDIIKQFCVDKIMDIKSYSKKRDKIGFVR